MTIQPVLIAGQWRESRSVGTFQAVNPRTKEKLPELYPISSWDDVESALESACAAARQLRTLGSDRIAAFLDRYAEGIEGRRDELVELAALETALAKTPRLAGAELPRTTSQLRQAATAARLGSWAHATIDTASGIRSCYESLGPVCVFGPNNFPFAFGSISGGDFAAALAAGNPVIAKANSSHPGTTRLFAQVAQQVASDVGLPPGTIQLLYRTGHAEGERMVSDHRVGATGYTGSRQAGLKLKAAADAGGKPIYLELSSVNPVIILPGAIAERAGAIADEFSASCLMGTGQFCTNPGMVLLIAGEATEAWIAAVADRFAKAPVGTLLSPAVASSLTASLQALQAAGAVIVVGGPAAGEPATGEGYRCANTLLRVCAETFFAHPEELQTEAFGNASLLVVASDVDQAVRVLEHLEGNLTGCIYSHSGGADDAAYDRLASLLVTRVGRLLNDKMPTGVAVSPAMNHGGPYPATGHPGFTAVGIPASLLRFAKLTCYDQVRAHRLPRLLQDANPTGQTWRSIDGQWTQAAVGAARA